MTATTPVPAERTRLVLVRHGESEWNAAGIVQGHGGTGLSPRGAAQAERVAERLAGGDGQPELVVRSDLRRVAETAAPLERRLGVAVRVEEALREVDVGWWSGKTHAEIAASDPARHRAMRAGHDVRRGEGETFDELRARVWWCLLAVAADTPGATVAVVTHGGPIRVAVAAALGLPAAGVASIGSPANASLTMLEVGPDPDPDPDAAGARLLAFNDTAHLAGDGDASASG